MTFPRTAVIFVQWGPLHEPHEAHEAGTVLRLQLKEEAREVRAPYVTSLRITEPDPGAFLQALEWILAAHPSVQVLYLSAHGLRGGGLCFDTEGTSEIPYADVGAALGAGLHGLDARPVVVFGACYALATETNVTNAMPAGVLEVVGFTATPSPSDVAALIAGLLKSDEERLEKVIKAAADAANAGQDVAAAAEAADDAHDQRLDRFVAGRNGVAIRHLQRDDQGHWTGYTIDANQARL